MIGNVGWRRLICRERGRKVDAIVQKLEKHYKFRVKTRGECGKIPLGSRREYLEDQSLGYRQSLIFFNRQGKV